MLNCVYHPIDEMRVVDNQERDRLLATGFWFNSPKLALESRQKVEAKIKEESKPKPSKAKAKLEEQP